MRVAAIAVTVLTLLLSVQDGAVHSGDEVALTGEFLWKHMNHTGDLDAVLTRTGDGAWGVEFRFVWEGELHVYCGTAEGSLTDGELRGSVVKDNPSGRRRFSSPEGSSADDSRGPTPRCRRAAALIPRER